MPNFSGSGYVEFRKYIVVLPLFYSGSMTLAVMLESGSQTLTLGVDKLLFQPPSEILPSLILYIYLYGHENLF